MNKTITLKNGTTIEIVVIKSSDASPTQSADITPVDSTDATVTTEVKEDGK